MPQQAPLSICTVQVSIALSSKFQTRFVILHYGLHYFHGSDIDMYVYVFI